MTDTDILIEKKLLPFRKKVLAALSQKHPYMFKIADAVLADKKNYIGLRVMEGDTVAGEYTLHLEGVHIEKVDYGTLSSQVHHPLLGVIKPYVIAEKSAVERLVEDEAMVTETFATVPKYLQYFTIKFLP